jgi:hypothetical protein
MIKNLGNGLKKMAQRAMMRGNRDEAQAIEGHGMWGVRSNMSEKNQSTQSTAPLTINSNVKAAVGTANLKSTQTKASQKNTDIGGSILGAINTDTEN